VSPSLRPFRLPFLVLPENQFAHAAVTGDDRRPQHIFLHGPSGFGKSRLASLAIQQRLVISPRARVQQMTASQFAAEFAEASDARTVPLFQSLTRELDLLVLEDLQVLSGRPQTQIQLLSLINELTANDARVIWTSRLSPGELPDFHPKLISRFRGGVLASLRLPGPDSRRLLIEQMARSARVAISPPALNMLADELAVSPRELLSAVERLAALARHDRRPIDSDLVRKFLEHELAPRKLKLDDICRAVGARFGASMSDLRSRSRARRASMSRQCAMLLARELTSSSLEQIGRFFGGRDHSTVVHACQRLAGRLESDADLRSQLNQIRHDLRSEPCG
jgi:chromosomal replication initiator protein